METPIMLPILARFLRKRLAAAGLRASVKYDDPVFGQAPGQADFRADARAEGDEVVVGGWLCQGGRAPKEAPWYSVRITRKNMPWVFARGEPFRNIAALELL